MKRTKVFSVILLGLFFCLSLLVVPPAARSQGEPPAGSALAAESAGAGVPQSPRLRLHYFYRRGLDAYESKSYREAIRDFEAVLKIDPHYRRADYYRRESWNNIAAGEVASKKAGGSGEAVLSGPAVSSAYERGKKCLSSGAYEDAVREFQKVLTANPEHRKARELLAEARLKLEKVSFEEQLREARRIAEEEESLRRVAGEEESSDLREAYDEGRRLYNEGELKPARKKFTHIRRARDRYRRTRQYIHKIDTDVWEQKERVGAAETEDVAIRKYTLGPEDTVNIVVRNHPEFSFGAKVEEDGQLIIPLTNEIIMARGLTRDELAEVIRKKLTAYVDNPFVNVFITGYNSKKYYVLLPEGGGTEYPMDKANMTLWDCMFRAGIPELGTAAMRRVQVITPDLTHPTQRWINVYAMLYEGKMENNIRIEPGTIIYYPMLAVIKFDNLIKDITKPMKTLADFGDDWDDWDRFRKEHLK